MKYSLLAVPLLISAGLHAQAPTPDGDQFQVNTYTSSEQLRPSVSAIDDEGNFVVVWDSADEASGRGVYGRRFDSAGVPLGVLRGRLLRRCSLMMIR